MNVGVSARPDPSVNQVFHDVLSAFAAFVNQMPHWLKTVFGDGSAAIDAFQSACSQEYDRAFEYRLLYNLQNESRHRTDVLHVEYKKALGEPGRVEASISDQVLDHAIADTKWQARVRDEIATRSRPIDAPDLVAVIRGCVLRTYLVALFAERQAVEKAIGLIQDLANDIDCKGDIALVTRRAPAAGSPSSRLVLTIQNLELQAAAVLKKALTDAESVLWPRFAVQVSNEWLEQSASDALLRAIADDPAIGQAVIGFVEPTGAFVGVTAASAYAAESGVARATVRSGVNVQDRRLGPAIPLP